MQFTKSKSLDVELLYIIYYAVLQASRGFLPFSCAYLMTVENRGQNKMGPDEKQLDKLGSWCCCLSETEHQLKMNEHGTP